MSFKFCSNISFMFNESSNLLERYLLAHNAGFKAVECAFPLDFTIQQVVEAKEKANVKQILLNNYVEPGEFGCAAIPGKESEFKEALNKTIQYAKALKCSKIHITSGTVNGPVTDEHDKTYESNLRIACRMLETENIMGVIEPINAYSVPNYYMNNYDKAINLVKKISSPSLKLQLDIFHLQHLRGDLTNNIKRFLPHTGHIQVAQVPLRGEPDTLGEINYTYVFSLLKELGYDDWIGLEYKPALNSKEGLGWISKMGFSL